MNKNTTHKSVLMTLFLFTLGCIGVFLVANFVGKEKIGDALTNSRPLFLVPVVIFLALEAWFAIFRWKYILNSLGEKVSFREVAPIWLAGNAFNYITPMAFVGGEGIRVMMLKKRFGVNYHRGSASVVLDQVFNGLAVWPLVFLGIFIFTRSLDIGEFDILVLIPLFFALVLFLFLFTLVFQVLRKKPLVKPLVKKFSLEHHKVSDFLVKTEEEFISFRSLGLKLFWRGFLLSFGKQLMILIRTALILASVGQGFAIYDTLVTSAGIFVSYIVPIPMALGLQETSQISLFSFMNWGEGVGIVFSVLYRLAELGIVFAGILVLIGSVITITGSVVDKMSVGNKNKGIDYT